MTDMENTIQLRFSDFVESCARSGESAVTVVAIVAVVVGLLAILTREFWDRMAEEVRVFLGLALMVAFLRELVLWATSHFGG